MTGHTGGDPDYCPACRDDPPHFPQCPGPMKDTVTAIPADTIAVRCEVTINLDPAHYSDQRQALDDVNQRIRTAVDELPGVTHSLITGGADQGQCPICRAGTLNGSALHMWNCPTRINFA